MYLLHIYGYILYIYQFIIFWIKIVRSTADWKLKKKKPKWLSCSPIFPYLAEKKSRT